MQSGIAGSGIPLNCLDHVAYVVKSVDETTKFLSAVFGLGPWTEPFDYAPRKEELTCGKPFSMRAQQTKIGAVEFHLIQPLDEDSYFAQWMKTHGEGLHHIAFAPSMYSEVVSKLQKQPGMKMMLGAGEFGKHWCYFEANPGNMIIEIQGLGMHDPLFEKIQL